MIIKSIAAALGAAGVALFFIGSATAAEPPPAKKRGAPSAYESRGALSIERWTGFYFGATVGHASFTDQSGGVGTLFAGYNWQSASTIYGLEADIGTGSIGGSRRNDADINAFGSVRGRLGTLVAPRTLLYATAGLAWADFELAGAGNSNVSDTKLGYQLGAGLEYQLAPQWRLRAEYIFSGFGSDEPSSFDPDFHTLRVGIAMKF